MVKALEDRLGIKAPSRTIANMFVQPAQRLGAERKRAPIINCRASAPPG